MSFILLPDRCANFISFVRCYTNDIFVVLGSVLLGESKFFEPAGAGNFTTINQRIHVSKNIKARVWGKKMRFDMYARGGK